MSTTPERVRDSLALSLVSSSDAYRRALGFLSPRSPSGPGTDTDTRAVANDHPSPAVITLPRFRPFEYYNTKVFKYDHQPSPSNETAAPKKILSMNSIYEEYYIFHIFFLIWIFFGGLKKRKGHGYWTRQTAQVGREAERGGRSPECPPVR